MNKKLVAVLLVAAVSANAMASVGYGEYLAGKGIPEQKAYVNGLLAGIRSSAAVSTHQGIKPMFCPGGTILSGADAEAIIELEAKKINLDKSSTLFVAILLSNGLAAKFPCK